MSYSIVRQNKNLYDTMWTWSMTCDFEKATRSHAKSQASHEKYIMRELRILEKSVKNVSVGIHI